MELFMKRRGAVIVRYGNQPDTVPAFARIRAQGRRDRAGFTDFAGATCRGLFVFAGA
jgi:hypothetical protein